MPSMWWVFWSGAALVLACGPAVELGDGGTSDGAGSTTTMTSAADSGPIPGTTASPTTEPGTSVGTTMTTEPTTADTGTGTETGELPEWCDIFADDCPAGYKCMPWANDGGNAWNATKCAPLDPNPRGIGESCTVEGSGVSGIDDCQAHAMCWDVDPETNMGECIAFCSGSEANPSCDDACSTCAISSGPLALCLPQCDPVGPGGCDDGEVCVPIDDSFSCAPLVDDQPSTVGSPCEFVNVCDPGLFCAGAELLPSCEGATGCCAAFCRLDVADPCDALMPGTVCKPWYEDGQGPPDRCIGGAVGACVIP